jgi:UDP-glucose 4-epimerase
MKILVTGAAGYIGGRLVKHLEEKCYQVRTTDLKDNSLLGFPEHYALDLLAATAEEITNLCSGIDIIVHLAALNEVDSLARPLDAVSVNVIGSLRLLQGAKNCGVRRFVYLSTAHVYGELKGKVSEVTCTRPTHPYSITHRAFESFLESDHLAGRIEGVSLRLSNSFGYPTNSAADRWTLIVNDLCRKAVQGEKLVLRSPGQVRDFVTLQDAVMGIEQAVGMEKEALGDGTFNLGGDSVLSMLEMAKIIAGVCYEEMGFLPEIEYAEELVGERQEFAYLSDKLKAIGYCPQNEIRQEIAGLLRYCEEFGAIG